MGISSTIENFRT